MPLDVGPPARTFCVFPDRRTQADRLSAYWREFYEGRRDVFFNAGEERPAMTGRDHIGPLAFTAGQEHAYHEFLPPEPPTLATMSPREKAAYYGAPPDVPEDFFLYRSVPDEVQVLEGIEEDYPLAPEGWRPRPVADWRERAGLPPDAAPGADD